MSGRLSSLPSGLFRQALCLSLDVYTSLRFPCLISALSFREEGCIGLRWKKRQCLFKRERKKEVLQRRQQNPPDSEKTLQSMSRGAVCGVFPRNSTLKTLKQTSFCEMFFVQYYYTTGSLVWTPLYHTEDVSGA